MTLLIALAGCEDVETVPEACAGDVVCPPPSPLLSWGAELWPGSQNGATRPGGKGPLVSQEEPQLIFSPEGLTTVRFTEAALLSGTVSDDDGQAIGRARVVAVLPSLIPGQNPRTFDTSTDPAGAFSLRVPVPRRPTEQPYRLWVGFDDAKAVERPPLWREGLVVRGDTAISLQAKRPTELATIRGRIVDLFGVGIGGMRVQVLDSARSVISSTGVSLEQPSGPDPVGSFRVLVDPGRSDDARLDVVAWPGPQQVDLPILSYTVARQEAGGAQWVDLRLPAYRTPRPFTLVVRGMSTSGAMVTVPGARVRAQVLLEGGSGTATYVTSGDTDGMGQVTLSLVPATTSNLEYTITVQSPAGSPLASDVTSLQVGKEEGYSALTLPLRTQLSGKLVSLDGLPVAGAQILARDISQMDQAVSLVGRASLEAVTPQTLTGADGRFALRLDHGDYDIDIIPMAGQQPRYTLSNKRVLSNDTELGFVRLPGPSLGRVQVLGPDGYPVSGATLRVFQMPDTTPRVGFACAELLPCSRQASLRAEITTDGRGRAQFLLPDATQLR